MTTTGFQSRMQSSSYQHVNSGDGLHVYIPRASTVPCPLVDVKCMVTKLDAERKKPKILFEIGKATLQGLNPLLESSKYTERYVAVLCSPLETTELLWSLAELHWLLPQVFSILFLVEKPWETNGPPNRSTRRWRWATWPRSSLHTRDVYLFPFRWNIDHCWEILRHLTKFCKWRIIVLGRLV